MRTRTHAPLHLPRRVRCPVASLDPEEPHVRVFKVGDRLYNCTAKTSTGSARVGDKVTERVRGGYTLHTHRSSAVRYRDVTIHGASMMAITEFGGEGAHS